MAISRLFKKREPLAPDAMLFSSKALVTLIIPLILQQILNVTVGTIDTIMVAYTGEAAVSGVSLVNTLDTLLIIFFTSVVGGGAVVVAHALGRKEESEIKDSAKQLLYISTFLALVLTVTVQLFRRPLLNLFFEDVEEAVMTQALNYFFFVSLSFPFIAINESACACFRSAGNSSVPLAVAIVQNLINLGGNALFIIGFNMGGAGAGLATLITRIIGSIILLILIHRKKYVVHVEHLLHYKPNFSIIRRILHIGIPNGIENAMFQFGRLLTQSLISTMGTGVIAANSVALTISNYQYMTGTACSSAMIPVVGRCIGAKEERQTKHYSRKILAINYALIWMVILGTMIFLRPLVSLYHLSEASDLLARQLIIYHALIAALIWPIGFMLPSAFHAAGDVRLPLIISTLSMWLFRVAGGYLLALDSVSVFSLFSIPGFGMGIVGVWLAMFIDWVFRCSFYFVRFVSGKWIHAGRRLN